MEKKMAGLSKSKLIAHRQCPKRLWLQTYKPELQERDSGQTSRMDAGNLVGDIARSLHSTGILIESGDLSQDLNDTKTLVSAKRRKPLFEATFKASNVLVKVDLLLPVRNGYKLGEVKSSIKVKTYHYEDSAIQTWVVKKCGLSIIQTNLVHICNSFVYPGNDSYDGLFTHANITPEILELVEQVPKWIKATQKTLKSGEPSIDPGTQCNQPFDCPFINYCSPAKKSAKYPVHILPRAGKLISELEEAGYKDLRKVPKKKLSNSRHLRIWNVTKKGKYYLDPKAKELLANLSWPRYYIDFETINLAVPVWRGTQPYQQVPFQWSCHIERKGSPLNHHEFLADGKNDPRREFTETLIKAVKKRGPVFVYNAGFENRIMRELASDFPEYEKQLNAIINRVVDLLPIGRDHYYHPDMMGSWSIKKVLPTIAPELDYSQLDVADGGMAMEAFAEIMHIDTPPETKLKLQDDLLTYCERDTLAMVKIAHFFQEN